MSETDTTTTTERYENNVDINGLECTQEYFVDLVDKLVKSVLLVQTMTVGYIGIVLAAYPYFRMAFNKVYDFLTSFGSGFGYITSAVYFLLMDFGYGNYMCQAGGYATMALGYIGMAIEILTFAQDSGLV